MKNRRIVPVIIRFFLILAAVLVTVIGLSQPSGTQASDLLTTQGDYVALRARAAQQGQVRVIVTLRGSFRSEGLLNTASAQSQRRTIQQGQSKVLGTLASQSGKYRIISQYIVFPMMTLEVDQNALQALSTSPDVLNIREDGLNFPTDLSSNNVIGAPGAWSAGFDGTGWDVAILDSGVQSTHPFLAGKVVAEACFSTTSAADGSVSVCPNGQSTSGNNPGQAGPGSGVNCPISTTGCTHGTHVAGIAAGKDYVGGPGYNGTAPGANIIAIQVFSQFNSAAICAPSAAPCISAFDSDLVAALQYMYTTLRVGRNVASVNMSLGDGVRNTTFCDSVVEKPAIDTLRSVNIATVIAAGNEGYTNGISGPGCISTAISVGATNDNDTVASFSNRANFMSLYAPGTAIDSSIPNNTFASFQGTSMAAPHVAGAWAVLMQRFPGATVTDILANLRNSGVPITNSGFTVPRIQLDAAVSSFATVTPTYTPGGPTVTNTTTYTPSATFTRTSTYTPVPTGQLVRDGSFEARTPWTQTSTNFGTPLCNASCGGVGPRTGSWWAWFGGTTAAETGTLTQSGIIPVGADQLNFYLWWAAAGDPTATFKVYIDSNVVFSLTPPASAYSSGYTKVSVNISTYANGASHTLKFEQINAANPNVTNINLDDVWLSPLDAPPTATNTVTPSLAPSNTATLTPSNTATFTRTNTPVPATATDTATFTNTPVPPTATDTATFTNTPVPATATDTATFTNTPVPPTATDTATFTNTPVPATATDTATFTNTPVPATVTPSVTPSNTSVAPSATPSVTPSNTSVAPSATPSVTPSNTSVAPSATPSVTPSNTPFIASATPSHTPTNTVVPPSTTPTRTPTNTPFAPIGFYRAYNLGGPSIVIDGHTWLSGNASTLNVEQATKFCKQGVTLNPPTDANRAQMIRCSVTGREPNIEIDGVQNGSYDLYFYIWEDNNPQTFSISVQGGQVFVPNINSGAAGSWQRMGPYTINVTGGWVSVDSFGGAANFSGIELYRR